MNSNIIKTAIAVMAIATVAACGSAGNTAATNVGTNTTATNTGNGDGPAWLDGGGSDILTNLGNDYDAVVNAAGPDDLIGACATLSTDTATAQAYAPVPVAAAQTDWATALNLFATGASECTTAFATGDSATATQAGTDIQDGENTLASVLTDVQGANGTAS